MCNCSKPITQSECDMMREFAEDPRFFIYHISDENGLQVAYVPSGKNPNDIAKERGFLGANGEVEWYNCREHPCVNED